MMWAVPTLVGFALHSLFERARRMRVVAIASILFSVSLIAMFGVYHSPFILQPSWQIVLTDAQGADWFLDHCDSESPFAALGVPPAYALGQVGMPEHFYYQEQSYLGASFEENLYLLLTARFRIASLHPILSEATISDPRLARPGFTREDFDRLEHDPSVDKLYTNGEFDAFLIRSIR
jgi:hypothetical protein